MKQVHTIDLRWAWEQLPTEDLEAMLSAELDRKLPADEKVLLLLHILEDRQKDQPLELTPREREAWERYKRKAEARKQKRKLPARWLSLAASVVLVVAVLFAAVPQQAQAETFWEMLQRMTSTVMEYFSPRDKFDDAKANYSFVTDNPGLQQVYDAAVELGATEPVVPMWLPDGYMIQSILEKNTPMSKGIWVSFLNNGDEIIYKLDVYDGEPAHQYYKDDTHYESREWDGTVYQVSRNINRWIVVWTKENIECILTLECPEETLEKILRSIYVTEAD